MSDKKYYSQVALSERANLHSDQKFLRMGYMSDEPKTERVVTNAINKLENIKRRLGYLSDMNVFADRARQ
jgi:hypothetical protein